MSEQDDQHFDHLLELIQIEREAEKEENKRELEKYPLHVRETLGKTVTKLVLAGEDEGVGGIPLLIFTRQPATSSNEDALSPFHSMDQGDNVLVTFPSSSGHKPMDGTLYDVQEFQVTVAMNGPIPDPLPKSGCQIDLLGSDATYKKMRQALNQMKKTGKPSLVNLREIFMGRKPASFSLPTPLHINNKKLNQFQVEAVNKCMAADDVMIIHGPPGTGKTTVLVEIILQSVRNGGRVLASAPSNIAVDNIVEKLLPWGLRIVRMGHPARTLESLRHVTLSALIEGSEEQRKIRMMDDERHRTMNQLRRRDQRGMVPYQEKREIQDYIQQLWKSARDMEFSLKREIIENAQVVLSTHGSVGGQLNKQKFDLVVMDEASQATEPLSWVPLTFASKVVFAGDSNQLPPTIYSADAAKKGLSLTLFDRLKKILPEAGQSLLRVQYRMHEVIMGFSSKEFYEGKLIADDSVKAHTADELPMVKSTALTEKPLIFIDTVGTGYEEQWNELLESRENEGEAKLVSQVYSALKEHGIPVENMAILAPYVAQVKKLRLLIGERGLEIGSIDSFQGREKEVVILSLVRSNEKGEVGFLSDIRRMNVGMTRARRLLIVIGDSGTISRHPFYNDFLEYVEQHDAHQSAWEWINQ